MRSLAFWDTSALVPLCAGQSATPRVVALYKTYRIVVWWATPVELASALARREKTGLLRSTDHAKATRFAHHLENEWRVIEPSMHLRQRAVDLLSKYDLRGADALQLSAALEWCDDDPNGFTFLTDDQRLRDAALRAGFDAKTV